MLLRGRHGHDDTGDGPGSGAEVDTSTKPASRGRDDELRSLVEAVSQHRLVTITGAPGIGKSHLARKVAARLGAAGELETVVVGLAGLVEAEQVPDAVAGVVETATGPPVLVVLDDCDHLVEACARVVESLLAADVRVLATSREPLRIPGEVVWQLGALSLPAPGAPATLPEAYDDSEAVQLFCERAAAAARGFVPTPDNIAAIVEICRRLDGLPLAIELAAGRAAVLSPAEMAAQLEHPLRLLTRAPRTARAGHQSLRSALESSWEALSAPEQVLLGRLSIFEASFTAEAARQVCAGDPIGAEELFDVLSALVERSLVVAETVASATRYRLLGVIRHFAAEKLAAAGESDAVADRHGRWFGELAAHAGDLRQEVRPWVRLEPEYDDIAAAFRWATAGGRPEAASLGMALVLLCRARGDDAQAHVFLDQIMPLAGDTPARLRASVLCLAGAVATTQGEFAAAAARLEASMAAAREADDAPMAARAQAMSGFVSVLAGEVTEGIGVVDAAVALARSAGDDDCLAQSLAVSARAHLLVGDVDAAHRAFEEIRDLAGDDGNRTVLAQALLGLGNTAVMRGDYHDARRDLTEALRLAGEDDDPHAAAVALAWLGELARLQGDDDGAQRLLEQCLELADVAAVPFPRAKGLIGLGRLAQGQGDLDRAQSCFEEALALARAHGLTHLVSSCLHGLGQVARAAGADDLAQSLLEEALATAEACSDKRAQAQALDELARMVAARGEHRRANTLHRRALALRHHMADPAEVADSLEGVGALRASTGDLAEAARLLGAAQSLRDAHGCVRPRPHRADHDAALALARRRLGAGRFDAEWSAGTALSTEEAVATASGRGRRAKRPSRGPGALTPAESEVAALAATGLTNEAIARQLVLSRRTVETHLQRAYSKLGITSRRELDDAMDT